MSDALGGHEDTEETGLNLFDDRASAAGNFPHAMLGYDRAAVDTYVRDVEQRATELRVQLREARREAEFARAAVGTTDFSRLGAHARGILQAAEAQAVELVRLAEGEADRMRDDGRRAAASLRESAQKEADDVKLGGLAGLRKLRQEQAEEGQRVLQAAQRDAEVALGDAQSRVAALLAEAEQRAAAVGAAAEVEAQRIRTEATRDAEGALLEAQEKCLRLVEAAKAQLGETQETIEGLAAASAANREEAAGLVTNARQEATALRQRAVEEAEEIRLAATREAEETLADMRRNAAEAEAELEEKLAWRREQLEREISALGARRVAMIGALNNLQELAAEAAGSGVTSEETLTLRKPKR